MFMQLFNKNWYFSKSALCFTLFLCNCFIAISQVGIGTETTATGTILHVEDLDGSGSAGVLFPRIPLASLELTDPLPADTTPGTMVYNTNPVLQTGYYFWTATNWQRLNATIGSMSQFTNSNRHTDNNLNAAAGTMADIFGLPSTPPDFNDAPTIYVRSSLAPAGTNPDNRRFLKVTEPGRYRINVNLVMEGVGTGISEVEVRLVVNGTEIGPHYISSEMDTNSSNRGSVSFSETLFLTKNSILSVSCKRSRKSNGNNVYLFNGGTSTFFIERIL